MKRSDNLLSKAALVLSLAMALGIQLIAASGVPMMRSADSTEALRGGVVAISGDNLSKANVSEIYLTNGRDDVKMEIVEQAATLVKVRVSKDVAYGRYSLMILTSTEPPMFIEQPVRLSVVEKLTPKPVEPEHPAPAHPEAPPTR